MTPEHSDYKPTGTGYHFPERKRWLYVDSAKRWEGKCTHPSVWLDEVTRVYTCGQCGEQLSVVREHDAKG